MPAMSPGAWDPAPQRAQERRRNRDTLGKLLAENRPYEMQKERGLVNIKTALSSLPRGLKAHMATDIAALSRNDIDTAIGELTKLGKRGTAADLRKFSRSFCEWAVSQSLAKFNPMAGLRAHLGERNDPTIGDLRLGQRRPRCPSTPPRPAKT
jgi:site-specific recombinase XerC